jgi:phenylalanine-4-hydroxylase
MELNEVLERLPRHLLSLVIEQPYTDYTAQDHAVWRYVMRRNVQYLPHVAHSSYLEGLKQTGISIDEIPHMYGMNRILKEIGWAAVAVDGFIPPAAFMEFQAYNVLVIAADIRPVNQVQYTPAPDIIHEAAGHAPIIADRMYAGYLRDFGKLGSMAFSSTFDNQIYEAIRHLSILKADPYSSASIIEDAESVLDELTRKVDGLSEMALLRNLHWWTVEYGLIGDLSKPRIYGAGLLSSIGESYSCLQDNVSKLPYSIDAQYTSFDITTQQPQLFVTPDFDYLNKVLDEFASTMAVKRGGLTGVAKALLSGNVATFVYSSGLQVSGKLSRFIEYHKQPAYLLFNGPVILASSNMVLPGHGIDYHSGGFSSPIGYISGIATPPELLSTGDLEFYGICKGRNVHLVFDSGVEVNGLLIDILSQNGKNLLFSFNECSVSYQGNILFQPEWGTYDMAVGAGIASCFSGVADPEAYQFEFPVPKEKTHKLIHSQEAVTLHMLYQAVRSIRENGNTDLLADIFNNLVQHHPEDWLLPLEIHEILESRNEKPELKKDILRHLKHRAIEDESLLKLIQDGLALGILDNEQ